MKYANNATPVLTHSTLFEQQSTVVQTFKILLMNSAL